MFVGIASIVRTSGKLSVNVYQTKRAAACQPAEQDFICTNSARQLRSHVHVSEKPLRYISPLNIASSTWPFSIWISCTYFAKLELLASDCVQHCCH